MKTQFILTASLAIMLSPSFYSALNNTEGLSSKSYDYSEIYSVEQENELEIEPWMTNDEAWEKKSDAIIEVTQNGVEDSLTIEAWMTDDNLWKVSNRNL